MATEQQPTTTNYGQTIELLASGVAIGDDDPEAAVPTLRFALATLPTYAPELAADADGLELRADGHVSIARAHLQAGRKAEAVAAMDEAIRSALGRPLPAMAYGPTVEELWVERSRHAEQHPGNVIVVDCEATCIIYVNERRVTAEDLRGLTAGTYRFWIEAEDGSIDRVRREVVVLEGSETLTVDFHAPESVVPVDQVVDCDDSHDGVQAAPLTEPIDVRPADPSRVLPRWAEVLGITTGAGLIVAGVVLGSFHGKCEGNRRDVDVSDVDACPNVWDNHPQDYALLGVGAGMLLLHGVFLTVDEVRVGRARGRQAVITWSFRF